MNTSSEHHVYKCNRRLQATIFLLIWPAANTLFAILAIYDFGMPAHQPLLLFAYIAYKSWGWMVLSFLLITVLEKRLGSWFAKRAPLLRFLMHATVVLLILPLFFPLISPPNTAISHAIESIPFIILLLEIVLYLAAMSYSEKQTQTYALKLNLAQSELNAIRAQTNPHFLFNTLNLIAVEIKNSPDSAQALVYDLADLLRMTVKLSHHNLSSVREEVEVIRHYLNLQQKRFQDRLSITLHIEPETEHIPLPSLLLLPVIENAVKHGVAPYRTPARISVSVTLHKEQLTIKVLNTCPPFNADNIQYGNGFNILQQTLQTHYSNEYHMTLRSTAGQACLTLHIPQNAIQ